MLTQQNRSTLVNHVHRTGGSIAQTLNAIVGAWEHDRQLRIRLAKDAACCAEYINLYDPTAEEKERQRARR